MMPSSRELQRLGRRAGEQVHSDFDFELVDT
jgi:hypothetical protein